MSNLLHETVTSVHHWNDGLFSFRTTRDPGAARFEARQAAFHVRHRHRLGPFMSLIHDPETYERFEKVILIDGVRWTNELAYHDYIEQDLKDHEYLGELIREKLVYYPTVTREPFRNEGRQTDLIMTGKLFADISDTPLDPATDRGMICGSPAMLKEISKMLDGFGFHISPHIGVPGDYVIERTFVEQ